MKLSNADVAKAKKNAAIRAARKAKGGFKHDELVFKAVVKTKVLKVKAPKTKAPKTKAPKAKMPKVKVLRKPCGVLRSKNNNTRWGGSITAL